MRKSFARIVTLFILCFLCVSFAAEADASALSFQNFTAGSGVTVSVPYRVNAGTERDPDTVTLVVDLSASVLEFQLTAVGSGFTGGGWCELDWDDDDGRFGRPREDFVQAAGGAFSLPQSFSLNPARLNLTSGGTRNVRYELDVDEEPYGRDAERHLRVTFIASGSPAPIPSTPVPPGTPTLSFSNFTPGSGVTLNGSYQANAGTEYDPDTVTLVVNPSATALTFQLTAAVSGLTTGSWCELDWDDGDEYFGAPRESRIGISGGSVSAVQSFNLNPARLNLASGASRSIVYELEADEEPYGGRDAERHLRITFTASGTSGQNPPNPVNPGGTGGNSGDGDGGGGCNAAGAGLAALASLVCFVCLRRRAL